MLRITDLVKSFGGRRAVDGVSLEIRSGEIFGLLGPNGAGKSTTINMAVGLLRPDSGRVSIDMGNGTGGDPTDHAVRQRLGVAPQALALYEELTAEENLTFFGRVYGLGGSALTQRVGTLLDAVGLADRRRSRVGTFSGGMKRRLNLAVAIIHDPPLILLDEPTVGVDPHSRNAIIDMLLRLKAEGRTMVYTTHHMEEAQRLCDRVAIIDHGRILAMGPVDSLITAHGGRSVLTLEHAGESRRIDTDDPIRELEPLLRSGSVSGVRIDRPDLESVFLKLTGRSLRD